MRGMIPSWSSKASQWPLNTDRRIKSVCREIAQRLCVAHKNYPNIGVERILTDLDSNPIVRRSIEGAISSTLRPEEMLGDNSVNEGSRRSVKGIKRLLQNRTRLCQENLQKALQKSKAHVDCTETLERHLSGIISTDCGTENVNAILDAMFKRLLKMFRSKDLNLHSEVNYADIIQNDTELRELLTKADVEMKFETGIFGGLLESELRQSAAPGLRAYRRLLTKPEQQGSRHCRKELEELIKNCKTNVGVFDRILLSRLLQKCGDEAHGSASIPRKSTTDPIAETLKTRSRNTSDIEAAVQRLNSSATAEVSKTPRQRTEKVIQELQSVTTPEACEELDKFSKVDVTYLRILLSKISRQPDGLIDFRDRLTAVMGKPERDIAEGISRLTRELLDENLKPMVTMRYSQQKLEELRGPAASAKSAIPKP